MPRVRIVKKPGHPRDHAAVGPAQPIGVGAESLAGWEAEYPDDVIRPQVAHGHPVRVLADRSRSALCPLVGPRGPGGFRSMLLGSVSHGLIPHAGCVIIVPGQSTDEA